GSNDGSSFKCRFPDGPATSTVRVSADDADGGIGSGTVVVSVANVAPTVHVSGPSAVDESSSSQRTYPYSATDPAGAADPLSFSFDCGAAGSYVAGSDDGSSFKCRFPDGPATSQVSVSASDGDGGSGSASETVTVVNVAPSVHVSGAASVDESAS